jgi:hypothetical protein
VVKWACILDGFSTHRALHILIIFSTAERQPARAPLASSMVIKLPVEVSANSSYNHAKTHGVDTCTDPGSDSTYGMIGCISLAKLVGIFLVSLCLVACCAECVWGMATLLMQKHSVQVWLTRNVRFSPFLSLGGQLAPRRPAGRPACVLADPRRHCMRKAISEGRASHASTRACRGSCARMHASIRGPPYSERQNVRIGTTKLMLLSKCNQNEYRSAKDIVSQTAADK